MLDLGSIAGLFQLTLWDREGNKTDEIRGKRAALPWGKKGSAAVPVHTKVLTNSNKYPNHVYWCIWLYIVSACPKSVGMISRDPKRILWLEVALLHFTQFNFEALIFICPTLPPYPYASLSTHSAASCRTVRGGLIWSWNAAASVWQCGCGSKYQSVIVNGWSF